MTSNADARFDQLFGSAGDPAPIPTMNPIDGRMLPLLQPAPARKEPQALTLLHGDALTAYLKRATTVNLRSWLQGRVGYPVPADWQRHHCLAVLFRLLEPMTDAEKSRDFARLLPNAIEASQVAADPTGTKAHQRSLDRKAAYSAAGQKGAAGTKERRAAAGVAVGSKYSDDEVRTIRWMAANGWNDKQVAAYFGDRTKPAMIWAIRTGVSYTKVTGVAETGPAK